MQLSNAVYDKLKWITMIVLPALGALYFGLSKFWPLPYVEEVPGTISLIVVFLGAILGFSSKSYNAADNTDGTLSVDTSANTVTVDLSKVTALVHGQTISLKVQDASDAMSTNSRASQ